MAISPARIAAFEILLRVERQNAFAAELLHSSVYQEITAADHRLATELVMGVLRWRSVLDEQVARFSSIRLAKLDPQVLTALRLGVYQLMFLDRIPARAAIHESVELVKRARKRSAVAFTNGILRKIGASKPGNLPPEKIENVSQLAEAYAHPLRLVERWAQEFGMEAVLQICRYDQQVPATALTVLDSETIRKIEEHGIQLRPGCLLAASRRLVAGDLAKIPAQLQQKIAVQDEASQLVALLAGTGSRILDCCAAPGGKTRVLARNNPGGLVIAADLHPRRADLLRRLVQAPNVRVIAADAKFLPTTPDFDRILVDVPCSGTGTLSRNPEIKWRLKPEDLRDLQILQTAILRSAMQHLVPGGTLVYSTCSLEKEENEEVIESALADGSFRLRDCRERLLELRTEGKLLWQDVDSLTRGPYLRTVPGVHPCDGFFAAILEKT
jgi:16S rRNA (cytosine967-C5)-methyltransferase